MSVVGLDQVLGLSTDLQCQFHLFYPSVFENYNDCIVLGRSDFFLTPSGVQFYRKCSTRG